jgi:hypothetical protein
MNKEELVEQVRKSRLAQDAYDGYFKEYVEIRRQNILDAFVHCDNDPEELMRIKYLSDALTALEHSMMQDIESGKLASIDLNRTTPKGIN